MVQSTDDLESLVSSFNQHMLDANRPTSSRQGYMASLYALVGHLHYELGLTAVGQITPDNIEDYKQALIRDGYKGATVRQMLVAASAFFTFLIGQRVMSHNPTAGVFSRPKEENRLRYLTPEEAMRLLEVVAHSPQKKGKGNAFWLRNRAIVELLYATGMMVSELTSLKTAQLYKAQDGTDYVNFTGDKARDVPINQRTVDALQAYMDKGRPQLAKTGTDLVFFNDDDKQLSRQWVSYIIKMYGRLAQIEGHVSPRIMRHSFAARMLEQGASLRNVQELLGNQYIGMTRKMYGALIQP